MGGTLVYSNLSIPPFSQFPPPVHMKFRGYLRCRMRGAKHAHDFEAQSLAERSYGLSD